MTEGDADGGTRAPEFRQRGRHDLPDMRGGDGLAEEPPDPDGRFSRRGFLGGAAGVAAAVAALRFRAPSLAARLQAEHARLLADPHSSVEIPKYAPDLELSIERDTDLVLLDFAFYGFKVSPNTTPKYLEAARGNAIVVQFPPQAIGEAAYFNDTTSGPLPTDPAPVLSVMSGPSRLSFSVPEGHKIPLRTMTAADLLDWTDWTLNVAPGAKTGVGTGIPFPIEPKDSYTTGPPETSVECPYALFLSPVVDVESDTTRRQTQFFSRSEPLTTANVTDCWSALLTAKLPQVAAVWSRDYDGPPVEVAPELTPEQYIKYVS